MENNQTPLDNNTRDTENVTENSALAPISSFVWDIAKIGLMALIIIIPIRFLVFQPFIVSGSSMEPNFHHGDYLIIDEISYRFDAPKRGDVVVLRFPNDPSQFFIKRIIGLPGDKLLFSNGKVKVYPDNNDEAHVLEEPYLPIGTDTRAINDQTVVLEAEDYFVLGDNRDASSDSRVWGPLERQEIIGKVWIKVLPISNFSVFERPSYSIN